MGKDNGAENVTVRPPITRVTSTWLWSARGAKPPATAIAFYAVMPLMYGYCPAMLTSPSTKNGRQASTSTETLGSRKKP